MSPELEKLEEELDRATVLEPAEMPEDVVTMKRIAWFSSRSTTGLANAGRYSQNPRNHRYRLST
ncbi:nucleoside diphosphate kinase regulator [Vibrio cholerae]|nr:nucleoside diphosphate kinase regulator [Vibrio cholerae]